MIAVVTGGSGSGKSRIAEQIAVELSRARRSELLYIATMRSNPADEETVRRIRRHRELRRGKGFRTVECPAGIASLTPAPGSVLLLEDLPNLLANEIWGEDGALRGHVPGPDSEELARSCIAEPLLRIAESCDLVVVTGNLTSDGAQYDEATSAYLAILNSLGAILASHADRVVEAVCGIPVEVKGAR